ncbi:MAG: ATP-binding cassette domain-containing protein [Acholeplasmataceae bacterium]|nr:ATP-binding cassette domain-containing protein [Acholeplasmataceae bacterium]
MTNQKIIEVNGLVKTYGDLMAVKGISFAVEEGGFFAFLGPNGAGKSTTINIICTLLGHDDGHVSVNHHILGKDDDQIRKTVGVVFQNNMLDKKLSVRENLNIRGGFYDLDKKTLAQRIQKLTEQLSMENFISQQYGTLSGGQRRRADIARALINQPKILILDEPTTGLDPKTRKEVWSVIEKLRKENMTIFLTTHYMEEAAKASHVVVIDEGLIVAEGTPESLRQAYSRDVLRLSGNIPKIRTMLETLKQDYEITEDVVNVYLPSLEALDLLSKIRSDLTAFEVVRGTMDDVFINITGKELRES